MTTTETGETTNQQILLMHAQQEQHRLIELCMMPKPAGTIPREDATCRHIDESSASAFLCIYPMHVSKVSVNYPGKIARMHAYMHSSTSKSTACKEYYPTRSFPRMPKVLTLPSLRVVYPRRKRVPRENKPGRSKRLSAEAPLFSTQRERC